MSKVIEKTLPQNVEAEQALLGSMIIDPEVVYEVAAILTPQDFYREAHIILFETIAKLARTGYEADFITILDELERNNKLDQVGGAGYITGLMNVVPTSGNFKYYADIVKRTAVFRRLYRVSADICAMAMNQTPGALELAEQMIFEISRDSRPAINLVSQHQTISEYMNDLSLRSEQKRQYVGLTTGLKDIDRMTRGFRRKDFVIVAGRPAIGKSALMMAIAQGLSTARSEDANAPYKGIIFSLEMDLEQLAERSLAMEANIDSQRMAIGDIGDVEWDGLISAVEKLSAMPLWMTDVSRIDTQVIRSIIRRFIQEHGQLDYIAIDYLQLVGTVDGDDNKKQAENRATILAAIANDLKRIAKEFNIVVIALAQLSRAVETRQDKRPQLSDLKESGGLEEAADIVMLLYRQSYYEPNCAPELRNVAELNIAKQRKGPSGTISLYFDTSRTRFADLETNLTVVGA